MTRLDPLEWLVPYGRRQRRRRARGELRQATVVGIRRRSDGDGLRAPDGRELTAAGEEVPPYALHLLERGRHVPARLHKGRLRIDGAAATSFPRGASDPARDRSRRRG